MPTLKELRKQLYQENVTSQAERNQRIAKEVTGGTLTEQPYEHKGPELSDEEVARIMEEPTETELSDEEVKNRLMQTPQAQFVSTIKRMAENYNSSPQYRELLDQELEQISAQIAELTQRRNIIVMARKGQV